MLVMCERAAPPRAGWVVQSVLPIAARPTATPSARQHARTTACACGLHHLVDTIELIVSELVTNAVQASMDPDQRPFYGAGTGLAYIYLRLSADSVATLVEVWDENDGLPAPAELGLDNESGRGLMLVDALAVRWGWDLPGSGKGKIVWALVSADGAHMS